MEPVAIDVAASLQAGRKAQAIAPTATVQATRATAASAALAPIQASAADIKQAIETANKALKQVTGDLEFAVDAASGRTVLRVIDTSTQQVIRQFPSEEMLAIARAIDRFQGLLLKEKA